MNLTHLHLLINHLAVFGSVMGVIVLIQGFWTRSIPVKVAAYSLFIIAATAAGIAYLTGEAAEDTVEKIRGISENMIEEHEDSAIIALISFIILGIASLGGIVFAIIKSSYSEKIAFGILLISLISFAIVARTSYLGGQIRHTELYSPAVSGEQPSDNEQEHEYEEND